MMKKGFFLSIFVVLVLLMGISAGVTETMLAPCEVDGAETVIQYRQRQQIRMLLDTPSSYPGYAFLGRNYGEWSDWSEWNTTAAVSSAFTEVETREAVSGVTEYRVRSRTCQYLYGRWEDWSDWTEEVLQESETNQVETCTFSIINLPDTALNVNEETRVTLLAETGTQLYAPADDGIVIWKSSEPDIALVDAAGYVSAKSSGEASIYAISSKGGNLGSIRVRVLSSAATIPESTKIIEDEAFASAAVTALDLRKANLDSIGSLAFSFNPDLMLVLTNGMNGTIEDDAFEGSYIVTVASSGKDNVFRLAENLQLRHYIYDLPRHFNPVTGIQLNTESLVMNAGESSRLYATVSPATATLPYVTWYSTNGVVQVDDQGLVYAVRPGTATVSAYSADGTVKAECVVTVQNTPVTSITLDQESLELTEGETALLIAQVKPDNATDPSVIWTSQEPAIASVIDGIVTANSFGYTVIEARSRDGSEVVASCLVTVHDRMVQDETVFSNISAENITDTDATIRASVYLTDVNPDLLGFYIGTDPENLQLAAIEDAKDSGTDLLTEISYNMREWKRALNPDTMYYFRFYMTFGDETLASEIQSFRTAEDSGITEDEMIPKGMVTDVGLIKSASIGISSDGYDHLSAQFNVPAGCTVTGYEMYWNTGDGYTCTMKQGAVHPTSYYDSEYITWIFDWRKKMAPGTVVSYRFFCVSEDTVIYSPELFFTCPRNASNYMIPSFVTINAGPEPFDWWVKYNYFVRCTQTTAAPAFEVSLLDNQHRIEISTSAQKGYGIFTVVQSVSSENLAGSLCLRIIPPAKADNTVTTRVAAVANVSYENGGLVIPFVNSKAHFLTDLLGGDDLYGNDKSMLTNATKIISAYGCTPFVGLLNTGISINPENKTIMKNYLASFFKEADDDDVSIIYVGGHGHYQDDGFYGTVLTGKNYNFADPIVFSTTDYVNLADLIRGTKVFIIDTCHSGALVQYFANLRRNDVCILSAHRAPVRGEDHNSTTIRSMPGHIGTYLAHYFLKGIGFGGLMLADNGDNKVTFSEICRYVANNVKWNTENLDYFEERYTIRVQEPIYYAPDGVDPIIYMRTSR